MMLHLEKLAHMCLFLQLRAFLKAQNLHEAQIFAKIETVEVS